MSVEIMLVLAAALLLDRVVGDPDWLWRRLPHPVVLFGGAIGWFDRSFNRKRLGDDALRISGAISIAVLLLLSAGIGLLFHRLFASMGFLGLLFETVLVAVFLAQKSLGDHVMRVASGLRKDGLAGGRKAVSMIVGRDPETLDEPAICRAAIESLAENFSDGVVAPAFWYAIFGLPGLLAYKMLNTADSMIGHKTPKYLHFGWASARLDDFANLPAARLSVLLFAAGAWLRVDRRAARNAVDVGLRDHGLHRSPNSGWPEAAMAGALDVQLAGPRLYAGTLVSEPMINGAGKATATVFDIEKAVHIFYAACAALMITVVFLVAVASIF
jgi:adenosylcobinamide-phosphate synthase